jgi:hypothetical protein
MEFSDRKHFVRQSVRLLGLIVLCALVLSGCSTRARYGPSDPKNAAAFDYEKDTIRIKSDQMTWEMIDGIVTARGGKKPGDLWEIDVTDDGDVRIRKHSTDGSFYPPGAAIEFWHMNADGSWHTRSTA